MFHYSTVGSRYFKILILIVKKKIFLDIVKNLGMFILIEYWKNFFFFCVYILYIFFNIIF